ncbi:hypothetical protein EJB05_36879, partial [Eragrostis curvula]
MVLSLVKNQAEDDSIVWTPRPSGTYSARSAYLIQFKDVPKTKFKLLVWKPWAPPKCRFFAWLLLHGRIWTAQRLQKRGWPNNYFCPMCYRNLETITHLFIECPAVQRLWGRMATWTGLEAL